jgi:hypothetical protein
MVATNRNLMLRRHCKWLGSSKAISSVNPRKIRLPPAEFCRIGGFGRQIGSHRTPSRPDLAMEGLRVSFAGKTGTIQ